ncbi:helix-turn-helix domain-containing protein [Methylocapsa palsarum]|uniref:DNA binding domain-containing protein, excisionase family n=1 Tax=Methylocapsa palsarum TaxID=1612308 RepID=A0A1I3WRY0_9HYPH|nr:excisionase family DNA-binding protein [Methylocapsa palsarum]SFK10100.1 DNA binding domain-containing protein, excisionase family [Methylocapsa palsarum]
MNKRPTNSPDEWREKLCYTIREWCDAVGVGRSTTYELIASGDLKAIKLGGRTLIPCDEAKRFVDALPALKSDNHFGAEHRLAPNNPAPGESPKSGIQAS